MGKGLPTGPEFLLRPPFTLDLFENGQGCVQQLYFHPAFAAALHMLLPGRGLQLRGGFHRQTF